MRNLEDSLARRRPSKGLQKVVTQLDVISEDLLPDEPEITELEEDSTPKYAPNSYVAAHIVISGELANIFSELAAKEGKRMEEVISERLYRTARYDAAKPLYFNDEERIRLEAVCGKNLNSASEAVEELERRSTISVEGIDIHLEPRLLMRIDSRRFGLSLEEVVRREVVYGLESFVGMR